MAEGTYIPGGPEYDNFSMYGRNPGFFPNAGWGGHSSPAYQASMPLPRDYMSRGNAYAGNSAYAPPGGINFGSPLMNVVGGMAINSMFGPNVRPFTKPDMPDMDYLRSKLRSNEALGRSKDIYGLDTRYLSGAVGPGLAGNNLFQNAFDMINPGGSQKGAFDMIYGRMGTSFGGDMKSQADKSFSALKQMNDEFRIKTGPNADSFDFNKSYGMDREQLADALDAGTRYGIGGLSGKKVAAAERSGRFGDVVKDNAKVFSAAQQVFGKDKGMDELAQLMTKSIDGFQGLDSNKATDLLNKLQSTSRAVNISTKAFAEYSEMFNELYKATKMGGATASGQIMDSAMQAKVATDLGRATGDAGLSDQNATMESSGRNQLDLMRSPTMRKAQALAAKVANMTDSQAASVDVEGVGNLGDLFKSGRFEKLLQSGDTVELERVLGAVNKSDNSLLGGVGSLDRRAANLSDADRADAAKMADFSQAGDFNGRNMRKRLARNLATGGKIDKDLIEKIGGEEGLSSVMDEFGSFQEATSQKDVLNKLREVRPDLPEEDLQKLATQMSGELRDQTNNERGLKQFGYGSRQDANTAFARSSKSGQKALEESRQQVRKDEGIQAYLQELSGSSLKDLGIREGAGVLLDVMKDLNGKEGGMDSIKDEEGKFSLPKLMEVAKKAGKKITKTGEMKVLLDSLNQDNLDEIAAVGDNAYQTSLDQGDGLDLAERKRMDVIRAQAAPIVEKFNNGIWTDEEKDAKDKLDAAKEDPAAAKGDIPAAGAGKEQAGVDPRKVDDVVTVLREIANNTRQGGGGGKMFQGATAASKNMGGTRV